MYPTDRVVELALVTLSLDGDVLDVYETLVQPQRDVSAGHIHGITASMVAAAPTFEEIAGDVAVRLHGACLVAHNLPFDVRMLAGEFGRAGGDLVVNAGVDTLLATSCRLTAACVSHGVALHGAHRAVTDAGATAELFLRVATNCSAGAAAAASAVGGRSGKVCRRDESVSIRLPDPPLIAYLASRLAFDGVEAALIGYLEVVGRAMSDLHLNREERQLLAAFAGEFGLSDAQLTQAHRRFVNELIDAAVADAEVTDEEYEALVRVAAALDVEQAVVERRIHAFRVTSTDIELRAGMRVVYTGEHPSYDRETLWEMARQIGLIPDPGVTKTTDLVAAGDPASNSGKAAKARRYGIPIVDVRDLAHAAIGDRVVGHDPGGAALKVITCPDCLATWTVPAASAGASSKRCDDCARVSSRISRSTTKVSAAPAVMVTSNSPWGPPKVQWLTCTSCGGTWHRESQRGRKPLMCPDCLRSGTSLT